MQKGDMNWTPIYLLILAVIAGILLITVIKPMFQQAAGQVGTAAQALKP